MKCQIEISHNKVAELVSVYGFPHSPNNRKCQRLDEGELLRKMRTIKNQLQTIILKTQRNGEII